MAALCKMREKEDVAHRWENVAYEYTLLIYSRCVCRNITCTFLHWEYLRVLPRIWVASLIFWEAFMHTMLHAHRPRKAYLNTVMQAHTNTLTLWALILRIFHISASSQTMAETGQGQNQHKDSFYITENGIKCYLQGRAHIAMVTCSRPSQRAFLG